METIKKDFSDVLGDQLDFDAGMACPLMKIHMRDDVEVKPINVKVARQVPLHLRDMANKVCLLYTSPSPRDGLLSRMPSSA